MRADGAVPPIRVEGTFQPQVRLQPAVGEAPRARALAVLLVEEGDDAPAALDVDRVGDALRRVRQPRQVSQGGGVDGAAGLGERRRTVLPLTLIAS